MSGKICFHLAEYPQSDTHPFAFMATVADSDDAPHRPLGRIYDDLRKLNDRRGIYELLKQLKGAGQSSPMIRRLFRSGEIFRAMPWSPNQAFSFLKQIESLEASGIRVLTPNWWQPKKRQKPTVAVTVGDESPASVGLKAILGFKVSVSLGGLELTEQEMQEILASNDHLVKIRGQWVEVDAEKLNQVLAHWKAVKAQVKHGGLGFGQAMRLVAGMTPTGTGVQQPKVPPPNDGQICVSGGGEDVEVPVAEMIHSWTTFVEGAWLKEKLTQLRGEGGSHPDVESGKVSKRIAAGAGLDATLRPYQEAGVRWLWMLNQLGLGGCLADDMGLGKTIQVLAVLSLLCKEWPDGERADAARSQTLLVVPASLIQNWVQETEKFASHLTLLVAHTSGQSGRSLKQLTDDDLAPYDMVITTYGTIKRHKMLASHSWDNIVLDEAQAIKNPGSQQTRAIKKLTATWRLALTGTPVENNLSDLWSIFDFINPGLLGSVEVFKRYLKSVRSVKASKAHCSDRIEAGEPVDNTIDYSSLRTLVQPYMLRRLKTDKTVASDLPDKTELDAYCFLSTLQATLYQREIDLAKELLNSKEVDSKIKRQGLVLKLFGVLKQLCNHPHLPTKDINPGDHKDLSGKFSRLAELASQISASNEKMLVFSQYRSICDVLSDFLTQETSREGLVLHGGTKIASRQDLVAKFQSDDNVGHMVLSLKAGGTGLNLTAATHVIHVDRWWNPAVENQATDRAFRIGQKKSVLVHKFVCRGTIEERIAAVITAKQSLSDDILSQDSVLKHFTDMSNEDLMDTISLDLASSLR